MIEYATTRLRALLTALAVAGGFAAAPAAQADTIELWNGSKAENATVLRAEEGILHFRDDSGERSVKLSLVKNITRPEDANTDIELLGLKRTEDRRRVFYLFGLGINEGRRRVHEPLVRVFVLDTDDRGERQVQLYTNLSRVSDPTMLVDNPEVDGDAYKRRYWQIPVDRPVAWHIEVWQDGRLTWRYDRVDPSVRLRDNWWATARLRRAATMKDVEPPREPKAVMSDPQEAIPPVAVQITGATSYSDRDSGEIRFRLNYSLRSIHVSITPAPEFTAYLLSENARGERQVTTVALGGGEEANLQANQATGSVEAVVPDSITHGLDTGVNEANLNERNRGNRLIAWRVEAKYGDNVVAFKHKGAPDVLASLPADWYK